MWPATQAVGGAGRPDETIGVVAAPGPTGLYLSANARPSEIVNLVGTWLVQHVEGFQWRLSGSKLVRDHHGNREEISFQSSRYNRTGSLVEVWLYGRVRSKALKGWREANPQLTIRRDDGMFGGLAGNFLGTYKAGQFEFAPGGTNDTEMTRLVDFVAGPVIRWLELGHDPVHFIENAPDISLEDPSAAEWLLSLGRPDLAARLIGSVVIAKPTWKSAFESGRKKALGGHDLVFTGRAEQWGWLAVVNGLDPP